MVDFENKETNKYKEYDPDYFTFYFSKINSNNKLDKVGYEVGSTIRYVCDDFCLDPSADLISNIYLLIIYDYAI